MNAKIKEQLILAGIEAAVQLTGRTRWLKQWMPRYMHIRAERAVMTRDLWFQVMRRDRWTCYLCGLTNLENKEFGKAKMEADHQLALYNGGLTTLTNLKCCCANCNRAKGIKRL